MAEGMTSAASMDGMLAQQGDNLTPAQVRELAQRIERGDARAREQLILGNVRLVASMVRTARRARWEDLFQEGLLGLIRAVDLYDWRRDIQFSTYATYWIRRHLARGSLSGRDRSLHVPERAHADLKRLRALEESCARSGDPHPDDAQAAGQLGIAVDAVRALRSLPIVCADDDAAERVPDHAQSPAQQVIAATAARAVRAAVDALEDPLDRAVIELRLGLDNDMGTSLRHAGRILGLSHERIRVIEQRALEQLRPQLREWAP